MVLRKIPVVLLSILSSSGLSYQDPDFRLFEREIDKTVSAVYGKSDLKKIAASGFHGFFAVMPSENQTSGFVVLSSSKGRFDYFDYMLLISNNFEIIVIKILKYRSEYGFEISNKRWLEQFYSKSGVVFEYRKNIDALSGATFSAKSLVNDINLVLIELKEILKVSGN